MAEAPRISGASLTLVPFGDEHIGQHYVDWLNDPVVMRFSEGRHQRHSLESCKAYVRSFDNSPHQRWAIIEQTSGAHIGNITSYIDVPNRVADIGILIGVPEAWGRGYGREAWQLVQTYQLTGAGARKVEAGTMAENRAMLRILQSCGMHEEGRRARHFMLDGRAVDLVQYAVFAN
jgi:RimJ/RimL family protein N-acetyltransferase